MRRFASVLGVTLVLWAAVPGTALAQTDPGAVARAEELAATARRLYTEGNYSDAVAAYRQAYEIAPAGALLYNIAYVYDHKLDLPDVAIGYYGRCLESPDIDPELMRRATERLGVLRAEKEARERPPLPADPPGADHTRRGQDPRWVWGWVGVGAGAAVFATGLTLGVVAKGRHEDYKASRDLDEKRSLRDEGQAMAIAGDVLMGVGIAGAVTGTVLLLTADRSVGDEGNVTTGWRVGVDPVPAGFVLTVGGRL